MATSTIIGTEDCAAEALASPHIEAAAAAKEIPSDSDGNNGENPEIPLLPASDPNDKNILSFKLGETIRLEEMGPIIINTDGKLTWSAHI